MQAQPRGGGVTSRGRTYVDVTVDRDAIYVHDGNVWTSAAVTAGINLALALVADDHGRLCCVGRSGRPSPS